MRGSRFTPSRVLGIGEELLSIELLEEHARRLAALLSIAPGGSRGSGHAHLRRLRLALQEQRQRGQRLIERHFPAGTRMTRPSGGYFIWLELPSQVNAMDFHRQAMALGISTAPGVLFSADGRFTHHLRLNLGHPGDERVHKALRQLGELACGIAGG